MGKLIREHVPDKNGKVLPAEVSTGTYEIRDLTNKGVGTLFEGKVVYDKTYGHVAYGCGESCAFKTPRFFYDPLGILFGGTSGQGVEAIDGCSGELVDVSDSFFGS